MKVHAVLYSRLKEIAGTSRVDLDLADGATVGLLWEELRTRHPGLDAFAHSVLFGLGVEFIAQTYRLRAGDIVAVMPPVQGG